MRPDCHSAAEPSAWVRRFIPHIRKDYGAVLDLACGSGRHTRLLLDAGHEVCSLDKAAEPLYALAALGANTICFDLENRPYDDSPPDWPLLFDSYAAIVVTNYLHRPLMPSLLRLLKHDGVLIYETFAQGNEQFGSPKNPDFLLRPGELLQLAMSDQLQQRHYQVVAYEHGYIERPRSAIIQRICMRVIANPDSPDKNRRYASI